MDTLAAPNHSMERSGRSPTGPIQESYLLNFAPEVSIYLD